MKIQYEKIMIRIVLLLLLFSSTIIVIDAKTTAAGVSSSTRSSLSWMIDTYPIPDIQSVQCRSTYRFCDPDQLIKNDIDKKRIENAIKEDRYVIIRHQYHHKNRNHYKNRTNPYLYNITNTSDTTTTTATAVNCIPKTRYGKKSNTMNGIMKWMTSWMMTKSSTSNDNKAPTVPTIKVQYGVALMNKVNNNYYENRFLNLCCLLFVVGSPSIIPFLLLSFLSFCFLITCVFLSSFYR